MSFDTQQLAWLLLETVDRMQGKGTTVRLVVPSDPEVARELEPLLAEHELLTAEAYLLERGYIATANLGLSSSAYTITPAGLSWTARVYRSLQEPLRHLWPIRRGQSLVQTPGVVEMGLAFLGKKKPLSVPEPGQMARLRAGRWKWRGNALERSPTPT